MGWQQWCFEGFMHDGFFEDLEIFLNLPYKGFCACQVGIPPKKRERRSLDRQSWSLPQTSWKARRFSSAVERTLFSWWNGPHIVLHRFQFKIMSSDFKLVCARGCFGCGNIWWSNGKAWASMCTSQYRMSFVLVIDLWLVFALLEESGNGTFARSGWAV